MAASIAMDVILTGASRGIGRALALALARAQPERRLILVARDAASLNQLASQISQSGGNARAVSGDLSSLASARTLGQRLLELIAPETTLVHNAGIWPARLSLNEDGLERAFVVNHLGPLAMQGPLLQHGRLRRVMAISAGLIALGRFDPARTPAGRDFSSFRTYANTKLCFAIAIQQLAAAHPELDWVALHPGVVQTDLGARPGPLGWLLELGKRRWERPEHCAARLLRLLERERWSPPGEARWFFEEQAGPWPKSALNAATQRDVREVTAHFLSARSGEQGPGAAVSA